MIKAQFDADFQSFKAAVDGAIVTLKKMEDNGAKVASSLARMGNSLSGVKIKQEAELMAEAVKRAGGVSTLTATELQRVASVAAEAAAKFKALGQAVPTNIAALASHLKAAGDGAATAETSFGTFLKGLISAELIMKGFELGLDLIVGGFQKMADIAMTGAGAQDVAENFEHLASEAGLLSSTLLGSLREGTHNTINDFELMKIANNTMASGVKLTDAALRTLATGAFALAQAKGLDVKEALDAMSDAMVTGRVKKLALLGVTIDQDAAEAKYLATLKTTNRELNDAGKLEATREGIIDGVTAAIARQGEQFDGLDERVAQAQTAWQNFTIDLGRAIATSTVFEAGITAVGAAIVDAYGGSREELIKRIAAAMNDVAIIVADGAIIAVEAGRGFHRAWSAVDALVSGLAVNLLSLATAIVGTNAAIERMSAAIPGASDKLKASAVESTAAANALYGMTKATREHAIEAAKSALGYSATEDALDKFVGVLVKGRDAMITARDTHITVNPVILATADALKKTGDEAQRAGEKFTELTEKQKKAIEDQKEGTLAVNAVMGGYKVQVDSIGASVVEAMRKEYAMGASIADLAKKYKLTKEQAEAFVKMLGEEAKAEGVVTTASEKAGKMAQETYLLKLKLAGNELELRKAQLAIELNEGIAGLDKKSEAYEQDLALLKENNALKVAEIEKQDAQITKSASMVAESQVQIAQEALDRAMRNRERFTDAEIKALEDAVTAAQKAGPAIGKALADGFEAGTASVKKEALNWSQAMDEVRAGAGQLSLTIEGSMWKATKAETQRSAGEHRYYGPVDKFGNPDYAALGLAGGGPVSAGGTYLVGEQGPELFSPSSNGSIVPNGGFGGGTTVINVSMGGMLLSSDPAARDDLRRVIDGVITDSIKRSRKFSY